MVAAAASQPGRARDFLSFAEFKSNASQGRTHSACGLFYL